MKKMQALTITTTFLISLLGSSYTFLQAETQGTQEQKSVEANTIDFSYFLKDNEYLTEDDISFFKKYHDTDLVPKGEEASFYYLFLNIKLSNLQSIEKFKILGDDEKVKEHELKLKENEKPLQNWREKFNKSKK